MDATTYIHKVRSAGFDLRADGDRLLVSPFDQLSDSQRQFLRDHKPAILAALRSPGAILDDGQSGNDIEVANQEPILATAYTPAGDLVMVPATSAAHAAWIERMNPPPVPVPMVRCADCQRATITNGIAACGAGVDSGLPIRGHWATDTHPCSQFQASTTT
jgi:hypothetical protein